jgi:acetate kinase
MFCYRVRKYLGAYAAAMGGVDAVLFAGGIGENQPEVRAEALRGLEFMGLHLDPGRNESVRGQEGEISAPDSPVKAWVVPTNEELTIARDVIRVLNGVMPTFEPPESIG